VEFAPEAKLLTIGIPVFNGKSLLRNCLQSVLNSTLPRDRFEIIIADDGSTEPETLTILEEYAKLLASDPGFFSVITLGSNSGGAARPRNRILDEALGEYVFFIDSDDTIGNLALERIADELTSAPWDWVALNQVPTNGRGAVCVVRQTRVEATRRKALSTLTVHKVFRRTEIERQQLRFDEQLPSGQDVSFAFSYILNASRFLMLGGYDYYYLIKHADNPNEPAHLSRRANTPLALIEKNERILSGMLVALGESDLPEDERRMILTDVTLPRVLVRQGYLKAIIKAGPSAGSRALRRLSELLDDPLVTGIEAADLKDLTPEHLAAIARVDWAALAFLVIPASSRPQIPAGLVTRGVNRGATWGRRLVDVASGRARHRRLLTELRLLRSSVEELRESQARLEAHLEVEDAGSDSGSLAGADDEASS
jgi:glycosyltransferase involved in cell wall biosynthesis